MKSKVYLILPAYNEEELINQVSQILSEKLQNLIEAQKLSDESCILFVDDGSTDNTWQKIEEANSLNPKIRGLKLAVNAGQQNAIYAGIMQAKSEKVDAVITLDTDLQDDIEKLETFIDKMHEGYKAVIGVHNVRTTDTRLKKWTALAFYKFMKLIGVNVIENHSEFRLINRDCIERLSTFKEANLFFRGIVTKLTNNYAIVNYERKSRLGGVPKFSFSKSLDLAIDGITGFSLEPIRMIFVLGLALLLFSLIFVPYSVGLFSIWFLGSLQIFAIGIVGEYVAKINFESKNRQRYFVEKIL